MRARLVGEATDYAWSSARGHAGLQVNLLLDPERPIPGPIGDLGGLAQGRTGGTNCRAFENEYVDRSADGERRFRSALETRKGRRLRPRKRGPKKRESR